MREHKGAIAWMAKNKVAANLLMLTFIIAGLFFTSTIKKEVFPSFELDFITISVAYRGAVPQEIEKGIILPIEEAIRDIEGIKEITATASENSGRVSVELQNDAQRMKVYQDIQQAVDAIVVFPSEIERPVIALSQRKRHVVTTMIYGDVSELALHHYAQQYKDQLLAHPHITQVELEGNKPYEVQITFDHAMLQKYNLTPQEVATLLKAQSVELSGGTIKTATNEILLRVDERHEYAHSFSMIPILISNSGRTIRLGDIAHIRDGFFDQDTYSSYNQQQAISLEVYRVGEQTPIEVSNAVKETIETFQTTLPDHVHLVINYDRSTIYQQRLDLLLKNAFIGLLLILIVLGAFLEFRLAFWVAVGIPTAFLGTFIFLPMFDVSVNMVSMFAFIIALGIVVDDAIIAGENIHEFRQKGGNFVDAAIEGAKDISVPLTFAIITNIAAFMPMLFVPGSIGQMFMVIPLVVITVFILSWIEALFILPHHLAYTPKEKKEKGLTKILHQFETKSANILNSFIETRFSPFVTLAMRYRYITFAITVALLIVVLAYAKSGRMGFSFMPEVQSDRAVAYANLPVGSTFNDAKRVHDYLIEKGLEVKNLVEGDLVEGYRGNINENRVRVDFYLKPADERPIDTAAFNKMWRQKSRHIEGVDALWFKSNIGGPGGSRSALTIELSHHDTTTLENASITMSNLLKNIEHVKDVANELASGKEQITLKLTPYAHALGVRPIDIAQQVRYNFQGIEAIRQLRERDEVRVRVQLSDHQRHQLQSLYALTIKTGNESYVPLHLLAEFEFNYGFTTISRRDGKRVITINANVEPIRSLPKIIQTIDQTIIPTLQAQFQGVSIEYRGKQKDTSDGMKALSQAFVIVLIIIYATLAIPFQSYAQPILIMIAIPFGVIGALLGHMIMGYGLSVVSVMGIVALSGVVINDALVLIEYANRRVREGVVAFEAIVLATKRRFRPVLLTTITTFGGLAPMIFETSVQARFLIPMAVSLGFGILFATFITLLLIPALYIILDDVQQLFKKLKHNV